MEVKDQTIVITGASRGLGRAAAIHLSQMKSNVVLMARTESSLQEVQDEIKALTGKTPLIVKGDVASEEDVDRMAAVIQEKFDRVDVLINNAGFGTYRVSENISNREMRRHFEVNFFGAYYCTKALLPLIKESGSGYVLNVGSLFSRIAFAQNSVYAATKFALAGFTQGLRRELLPAGIGVGLILLGSMRSSFRDERDDDALKIPSLVSLDPKKVAVVIERMIRRREKEVALPGWMMLALRVRYG